MMGNARIVFVVGATFAAAILSSAQTAPYKAPRVEGGTPDFHCIWQSMNEATYDLEGHVARPAMALSPGPYGPVPSKPVLALGAVGASCRAALASSRAARFLTNRTH